MPQASIRVLHVDDDPAFGDLTATFLERQDDQFAVETATSAAKALDSISDRPPDCIVSDYDMPSQNGIEFLQRVRDEWPELPFILFTGKGSEQVASEAISAGVTDYLQKGTGTERYELLTNRIKNAVQARRATAQLSRHEELMRLTEVAGDTGGWELDMETEEVLLTEGTRQLLNLAPETNLSLEEALELYHPDDRDEVRATLDQAAKTGGQVQGTWRLQPNEGEQRLLDVTVTPDGSNGDITTLRGVINDVTERYERREELKRQNDLFAKAQGIATIGAWAHKIESGELRWTDQVYEMHGVPKEFDPTLDTVGELYHPDDRSKLREAIDDAITAGEPYDLEVRMIGRDDGTRWFRTVADPQFEDGTPVRIRGIVHDITDRKKRERELESERRFIEQSLNALDDLFYVLDTDGTIRRWNDRAIDVTGYTESEVEGMHATEIFPEDEQEKIADAIGQTLSDSRVTVEADLQTADDNRIPYEWTGARLTDTDGTTTGIVGIGRDLSERRQRERRFRALVEESNDVISIVDADGRFQYQSPSLERILGHDPEETVGDLAWEYIHPDDREAVMGTFEEWLAGPEARESIEYRARHADGSWRWFEARASKQFDNPAVEGYVVNSRDVTSRKEREQELARTRDLMSSMEELADVGAWEYNPRVEEQTTTTGTYRIYGVSPETDLTLEEGFELFSPDDRERLRERFEECLKTGKPYEMDVQAVTPADEQRWLTVRGERVRETDSESVVQGYLQDITDQKNREQQLTDLNKTTQRLSRARSRQEIAEIGTEAAQDILGLPANGLHFVTEDGTELVPAAQTEESVSLIGDAPTLLVEDSIAGRIYRNGEPTAIEDVQQDPDIHNPDSILGGHLYLPLGDHGVLVAGSAQVAAFDDTDITVGELLAGNLVAALDRVDRAETAKQRQEQLALFFEESPLGAIQWDETFRFDRLNERAQEILGYSEADLRGESWEQVIVDDDRDQLGNVVEQLLEADGGTHVINENITRSGEVRTCEWHNRAVTGSDGEVRSIFSKFYDVTERERRKQQLEEYETVLKTLSDAVYVLDEDGRFTYINDEFADLVGYDRETIIGNTPSLIKDEVGVETVEHQLDRVLSSDGPDTVTFEVAVQPRDGDPIVCEDHMGVLPYDGDQFNGSVGTLRDITERMENQRRLERYKTFVEATGDPMYALDADGHLTLVNEAFTELTGYDRDELIGSSPSVFTSQAVIARGESVIRSLLSSEADRDTFEFPVHTVEGDQIPCECHVALLPFDDEFRGTVAVLRDITEREEREGELRQLKEEYQSVVENVQDSLFLWEVTGDAPDHEFKLRRLNPANASLLGVSAETVQGKTPTEIFGEETGRQVIANYKRSTDRVEPVSYEEHLDLAGEARKFETTVTPVEVDGEVTHIVGVAHDITDRLERERELKRQNERLDEFASIVSHDLRSPLTVAAGRLELAQETCESPHLAQAADAIDRSQALIEDMLTLAREGKAVDEVEPVELADVAESSWHTVETGAGTLEITASQLIGADRSRFKQLLENLYRNAVEHGDDDVTVSVGLMDDGFYVADTGPGFPETDREEVFEAGYSTSEEGTGFGLRIVKQVVEAHGWVIRVTDSDDDGARFEITGVDTPE